MLPPQAEKKMQAWIRSRHLIYSGSFFVFETVESGAIERFTECVQSLGGTLISVDPIGTVWIGGKRKLILHQARASIHTPHHNLREYWIKYGSRQTRFDDRC